MEWNHLFRHHEIYISSCFCTENPDQPLYVLYNRSESKLCTGIATPNVVRSMNLLKYLSNSSSSSGLNFLIFEGFHLIQTIHLDMH